MRQSVDHDKEIGYDIKIETQFARAARTLRFSGSLCSSKNLIHK